MNRRNNFLKVLIRQHGGKKETKDLMLWLVVILFFAQLKGKETEMLSV